MVTHVLAPLNFSGSQTDLATPRVVSIAGSDPSGGAGIQADIKAISAQGGYAMAVIAALTAQNTQGVSGIHVPPSDFLSLQLSELARDVRIDAVKIGMLPNAEAIAVVRDWLQASTPPIVVLDPVMVASSGDTLSEPAAIEALRDLLPHAHIVTPNIPELAALLGVKVAGTWADALAQGKSLAAKYGTRVLVKGGHLDGKNCPDALVTEVGEVKEFAVVRIASRNTHGTGCSLSSALATLQARNHDWVKSVGEAKEWLLGAIASSEQLNVGAGRGPVNHFHNLWASTSDFSYALSESSRHGVKAIMELEFIKVLAEGTLPQSQFAYYIQQDAQYLNAYSRVLARASELAPNESEQRFWARGAQNSLEVELALHQDWMQDHHVEANELSMGPVTKSYTDHLRAVAFDGSYAEVVAAVLPCYWLYAEVGALLTAQYQAKPDAGHPYAAWMESYADVEFAVATQTAIDILIQAGGSQGAKERQKMQAAFDASVQFEIDFFDAPRLFAPPRD